MRLLATKTNVNAPDSDYPFGRIRNNPGNGTGTPVNELLYGDMHQFFEKLMDAAGITANGLPDNDYSGFQLFEALDTYISEKITAALFAINPAGLKLNLVEIIDWDMDANDQKVVTHGVDPQKVVSISAVIKRDDNSDSIYVPGIRNSIADVDGSDLMIGQMASSDISLRRRDGSFFDSTSFNATGGYVRGYLLIFTKP